MGDVAVVGGGLGGLTAALYLARAGRSVTIFDARQRLGGRAVTDQRRGFLFNRGPHALYRQGEAEAVLTELGIVPRGGQPHPGSAMIVRNDERHLGPSNLITLLRTTGLTFRDKRDIGRLLVRVPRLRPAEFAHLTVDQWLDASLSSEGARQLAVALVRVATYTSHHDVLSAEVAIGQVQRSLGPGVLYLDGGWQQLVDRLLSELEANPLVDFRLGRRLTELPDARAVVVATGDPASTDRLLSTRFDAHPGLGPASYAACLDLGVTAPPDVDLMIGIDEPHFLSNHSAAARLAPDGRWHVAAVRYLAHRGGDGESDGDVDGEGEGDGGGRPGPGRTDRSLLEGFAARAWNGADGLALVTEESRYLHRMVTVSAVAVASGGGLAGRPGVTDSGHDNVFLVGDWVGGRGHLADASLASARAVARAARNHLDAAIAA